MFCCGPSWILATLAVACHVYLGNWCTVDCSCASGRCKWAILLVLQKQDDLICSWDEKSAFSCSKCMVVWDTDGTASDSICQAGTFELQLSGLGSTEGFNAGWLPVSCAVSVAVEHPQVAAPAADPAADPAAASCHPTSAGCRRSSGVWLHRKDPCPAHHAKWQSRAGRQQSTGRRTRLCTHTHTPKTATTLSQ